MAQRGRPRSFDPAHALDQALAAFWRNGFEATSMSDLVTVTGLNSPSLYAAFGSKEALYAQTVRHYRETYADRLLDALTEEDDAISGLEAMFAAAIELFTRRDLPRGCFVVSAFASNAPAHGIVQDMLSRLRQERTIEIAGRLRLDVVQGRLQPDTPVQALADMYSALLQGTAVAARDGTSRRRLALLCEQSLALLRAWAVVPA